MTPAEQTEYWLKFHRWQLRYEAMYVPKFNAALKAQTEQYIESQSLMKVTATPIAAVLTDLYTQAAYIWAHRATTQLRKERLTMGFSERIIELMRQYYGIDLLNLADDITQTTKDVIAKILMDAATQGLSLPEVVKLLRLPGVTINRARTIARTETVGAANSAATIAAGESRLVMDKQWIAARDSRTRPDHRDINQHIVGFDDDFIVGGMPMSFPGDKRGGAKEVINCRCTVAFIPKRDANGRLIRKDTHNTSYTHK